MYTGIKGSYLSLLGGLITKPKWQKKKSIFTEWRGYANEL